MSTTEWRNRNDFLEPGVTSDLESCDREAIHLIPAIQPGGSALVSNEGVVIAASSDLAEHVGRQLADVVSVDVDDLVASGIETRGQLGGHSLELRAHLSRGGQVVVEGCLVDEEHVDIGSDVAKMMAVIRDADGLAELLQAAAECTRQVLGFDRVWVYRFDDEYRGEIVAEAVDSDRESFLGLHFGEGDIPAQARALFLEQRVRIIRDTSAESVPIEPSPLPSGEWLDTSELTLRAVSPIHLTYLRNMGVTASASMAIIVGGRLWGLVSGHHYSGPRHVDASHEQLAGIISDLVSMQVTLMSQNESDDLIALRREHLDAVLAEVTRQDSILDALFERSDDVLALAGATGCVARLVGRSCVLGDVPSDNALDELFEHLDRRRTDHGDDLVHYESMEEIVEHVPAMASHVDCASGILAMLVSRHGGNWLVWFRPELIANVSYGDRSALHIDDELTPQNSFAQFTADVTGQCEPWGSTTSVALVLRSQLGSAIFQQSEQLAKSSAALRSANAELDRFAYVAAHDLKEPLRGIHNYTDLIEEDFGEALGSDGIVYLSAVRRLSGRMTSLVQSLLTYATVERSDQPFTTMELSSLVPDAVDFVRASLEARGGTVDLIANVEVHGDRLQLVQVLSNLLSNAIKYTDESVAPHIQIDVTEIDETTRGWNAWPQYQPDLPAPIVISVRDNGIGVPEHMAEDIFEVFRRLHGHEEFGGGSGAGLTISRRIADRHGGMLWVEPNSPTGSVFHLGIPPAPKPPAGIDTA